MFPHEDLACIDSAPARDTVFGLDFTRRKAHSVAHVANGVDGKVRVVCVVIHLDLALSLLVS